MTLITFKPVKLRATKTGKCLCGKTLKRTYTFEQTINPFNKNKDGTIKNRYDIWSELKIEAEEWKKEPCRHAWAESYRHWPDEIREAYNKGETVKIKMDCGFETEVAKPISNR